MSPFILLILILSLLLVLSLIKFNLWTAKMKETTWKMNRHVRKDTPVDPWRQEGVNRSGKDEGVHGYV